MLSRIITTCNMTLEIIIEIVLLGIALSMDAFAVSITDGLIYQDINKKKSLFIALVFGLMQGLMPLIGYWLVEIAELIVKGAGNDAGDIMSVVVIWVAFALLLVIGGKMIIEAILEMRKPQEEKKPKSFSIKEVLLFGVATSIDAMATGVTLHAGLSNNSTVWLHVSIITIITFGICLIGLFLGKSIVKLLKGKTEITSVIGGVILILLAVWIVVSHYLGI